MPGRVPNDRARLDAERVTALVHDGRRCRSSGAGGACGEQRFEVYLSEFVSLCHAVNVLGEASPRALDAISSLG